MIAKASRDGRRRLFRAGAIGYDRTMKTALGAFGVAAAVVLASGGVARAQSLNVDFGLPPDAPAATYAAAGLPGVWNSIEGDPDGTGMMYPLVALDGSPTAVVLTQIGGTELLSASDPSVSGDDAALLNDALITYTSGLETCLFVNGLEPGTYEVTMYAWMPNAPAVMSRVRHDLATATEDVGGAWPGAHAEGVTYARTILEIPADGFMGSHSGIVPGALAANGAALNGFQLRKIVPGTDAGPGTDAAPPPGTDAAPGTDAGVSPGTDAAGPGADAGGGGGGGSGGCHCAVAGRAGGSGAGSNGGAGALPVGLALFVAFGAFRVAARGRARRSSR